MNSEKSLRSVTKNLRSVQSVNETLNISILPSKINPHRMAKQVYDIPVLSEKAMVNIKRNSAQKRMKTNNRPKIVKNISMSDLDTQSLGLKKGSSEILAYHSELIQESKENVFLETLTLSQNPQDVVANQFYHSESVSLNSSKAISSEFGSSQKSYSGHKIQLKLNRFSTYRGDSTDSKYLSCSQDFTDSQSYSVEETACSITSIRDLATSNISLNKGMSHMTQDNDYSDRETAEETVSYMSEQNLGSQIRLPKKSLRENSFEKYGDSKGPFCNSQEDSCCTTLDCDETLGCQGSGSTEEKKEDSLTCDIDFDNDFTLFSSTSTTPNKKQSSDESLPMTEAKLPKKLTVEEELASFKPEKNPCAFDSDTISYLINRESDYAPDPHYLEKKQNQVNWSMRAILFDWMMEVSMEFCLKRETFHYAVNYIDRYLSVMPNMQKWELQLVGVTALYIAAKVEEIYPPRVASFAKSTDNAYSTQQILSMELKMVKALKWLMTPPSMNTWANWYMNQWDLYIERSEYAQNHPLVVALLQENDLIQFKQSSQKSYVRFREMMQLIDCAVLDIQTLQYKPRALIASIMYVLLGKYFKQFTQKQIYEEFPRNSRYLIDPSSKFNELFGNFLLYSFGFELTDLLPSIQYISTYIYLPVGLQLPKAVNMNKENVLEGHFEEFLAYQTHHSGNLHYIKRRPRSNF